MPTSGQITLVIVICLIVALGLALAFVEPQQPTEEECLAAKLEEPPTFLYSIINWRAGERRCKSLYGIDFSES
jgi:hypothetical protein